MPTDLYVIATPAPATELAIDLADLGIDATPFGACPEFDELRELGLEYVTSHITEEQAVELRDGSDALVWPAGDRAAMAREVGTDAH